MKVLYEIKTLENLIFRCIIAKKPIEFSNPPTPTQMQIMEYIVTHESEGVYQRDLESALNLRRATVSKVLQTMEKNHLIKRMQAIGDGRTKKIYLEQSIKDTFNNLQLQICSFEDVIIDGISKKELAIFHDVIIKMQTNVLNYSTKGKEEIC